MKFRVLLTMLFFVSVFPALGCAHAIKGNVVDVRIISDHGGEFAKYRTFPRTPQDGKYFFMEAVQGERYSIRVENRSSRRIGVVVAVDGRNIVNGEKSNLRRNERMYIIDPYGAQTYEGWRTGMDRTNRFYFTNQSDSYAEKVFSDGSAMGTIALAVYREKIPVRVPHHDRESLKMKGPGGTASSPALERRSSNLYGDMKSEQAGTGFGETTHSPVRIVEFQAETVMAEKIVLKYEWQKELCKKGIIPCEPKNRLWPDGDGFAPIPRDVRG
jgi:hypothetical protein